MDRRRENKEISLKIETERKLREKFKNIRMKNLDCAYSVKVVENDRWKDVSKVWRLK